MIFCTQKTLEIIASKAKRRYGMRSDCDNFEETQSVSALLKRFQPLASPSDVLQVDCLRYFQQLKKFQPQYGDLFGLLSPQGTALDFGRMLVGEAKHCATFWSHSLGHHYANDACERNEKTAKFELTGVGPTGILTACKEWWINLLPVVRREAKEQAKLLADQLTQELRPVVPVALGSSCALADFYGGCRKKS